MNEQYWKDFYSKPHTLEPSPFARWVRQSVCGKNIVDLGCGNGRDTNYLRCMNLVMGVDLHAPEGEWFRRQSIESFLETAPAVDVAYCRFVFHAIEPSTEKAILSWVGKVKATLYLEARSIFDHPHPDHDRRLVDGQLLLARLLHKDFHILHYQEGYGMAQYGSEDPHVVRIVAKGNK